MSLNTRLANLLNHIRDLQLTLPERLTDAERAQIGTEQDWSFKDGLAHNITWANRHQDDLEKIEQGETWSAENDIDGHELDAVNHTIFEAHQHVSWDAIQSMIRDTYARGLAYIDRTSEETLLSALPDAGNTPVWRALANHYVTHPMIHVWEYLRKTERPDMIVDLFGEAMTGRLLDLNDDARWRGTTLYNLACVLAISGKTDLAITKLGEALQAYPGLTEWSKQDADLDSLRGDPAYQALYA